MAIASILMDPHVGSDVQSDATEAKVNASIADSKAVVASTAASVADSKAVSNNTSASLADSKAVSAAVEASTADSNALSTATIADSASNAVDSAIGSEPGVGDYKVTDLKRNTNGDIVFEYDDSQIT